MAHHRRRAAKLAIAFLAISALAATSAALPTVAQESPPALLPAPVSPVPPLVDDEAVLAALPALDAVVEDAMARTGVPGIAVGVVYDDRVVYAKGFGVRAVGQSDTIDPDTVFLLASVSKPIAATVIAGLVGDGVVDWTDPARTLNPAFALSDPYVTTNATLIDLLSHRSGLLTGAGDLLEDLGFDRDTILQRLRQQPLDGFRSSYHYSNFGFTAGAVAAAAAAGVGWEELAETTLFEPAGMTTASYRHADYLAHDNRSLIHQRDEDGNWVARYDRNADAEAPAGGASASLNDVLTFVRLILAGGELDGRRIVDRDALSVALQPHAISGPPALPARRASFYGLGWGVSYDDLGRVLISHSGAFYLGAATNISMLPGEGLGIVVLTNGEPIGVAEAISAAFLDIIRNGSQTVDWIGFFGAVFEQMHLAELPAVDYRQVPANPAPMRDPDAYVGTYNNDYYGPLTVTQSGQGLAFSLGPDGDRTTFALTHFDGDTFTFDAIGENANGLAGAIFTFGDGETASQVVLDYYDQNGLGVFVR